MVDEEDLYTLKVNCKGQRTVGKAGKAINVEKNNNRFKKLKFTKERTKKKENHKTTKAQHRGRGL